MALIDHRGRLFGRINLIDALVGAFVLMLIPMAYGAFLLFRSPNPTIISVEPGQIVERQPFTLRITGTDLRPYLRARLGTVESDAFLVQSPTIAEVKLPAKIPAGTYDLALFDEGQELVRKPAAVTLVPVPPPPEPPPIVLQVVGSFLELSSQDLEQIRVGAKIGRYAEVLALRPAERGIQRVMVNSRSTTGFVDTPVRDTFQMPAIIRLRCEIVREQCNIGGDAFVLREAVLPITADDGRRISFLVTEVRPADAAPTFPVAAPIALQASGAFIGLSADDARSIQVGSRLGSAEVVAIGEPEPGTERVRISSGTIVATPLNKTVQMPAVVRITCQLSAEQCRIGDVAVAPDMVIKLPASRGSRQMSFLVRDLQPADARIASPPVITATATLRVRFVVHPEVLELVEVGDIDVGTAFDARRATLTAIDPNRQEVMAIGNFDATPGRRFQIEQPMVAFTGTVRVPVTQSRAGWEYKGRPVKVGTSFVFETADGFMEGSIVSMTLGPVAEARNAKGN